jgi:hypothetical protein
VPARIDLQAVPSHAAVGASPIWCRWSPCRPPGSRRFLRPGYRPGCSRRSNRQPAISIDRHELILMPGCLAPCHDRFDLREDNRPDFRPAILTLLPQGHRMLSHTEAGPVSVVIKLDKIFAPPKEHRVARVQQGIYSVQQYLRPSINWAYRGLAPIERAGQLGHLADPEKPTRSFARSRGKRRIFLLFRGRRHMGSSGRSGGIPCDSMTMEAGTPSRGFQSNSEIVAI